MAAYETYETDNQDHDTMEMQNTQAAEKVIYKSIILVGRNVLNLKVFRMAFLCLFIIFFKTFFKAPVAVPPVIKGRGHKKVEPLKQ